MEELAKNIPQFKQRDCEKKFIVEVEKLDDALLLAAAGVDGLQFDKVPPQQLKQFVEVIRESYPGIVLIGAGGIKESNVIDYAASGVAGIVTTSMYFGRPLDISVKIEPI